MSYRLPMFILIIFIMLPEWSNHKDAFIQQTIQNHPAMMERFQKAGWHGANSALFIRPYTKKKSLPSVFKLGLFIPRHQFLMEIRILGIFFPNNIQIYTVFSFLAAAFPSVVLLTPTTTHTAHKEMWGMRCWVRLSTWSFSRSSQGDPFRSECPPQALLLPPCTERFVGATAGNKSSAQLCCWKVTEIFGILQVSSCPSRILWWGDLWVNPSQDDAESKGWKDSSPHPSATTAFKDDLGPNTNGTVEKSA